MGSKKICAFYIVIFKHLKKKCLNCKYLTVPFRTEKPDIIPLLVGFTGGQVHLIDPVHKVSIDPYPVHKFSTDPYPVHKVSIDSYPVHKVSIDSYPVHKVSIDPYPVHKVSLDPYPVHKDSTDPYPVHKDSINSYPVHKVGIDPYPVHKVCIDSYPGLYSLSKDSVRFTLQCTLLRVHCTAMDFCTQLFII